MKRKLPREIFALQFAVIMNFSSLAILNLMPLFLEHLGGMPKQIGFIIGIFSFAAFVFRPFGGWILGRVDAKKIHILGLFVQFVATCLYLLLTDLGGFVLLIRILHGFGFSIFIIAALLITVNLTNQEQRTYALGVVSSGFVLPLLLLPFLGEKIIARFGYDAFFILAVFLTLIPLIYLFFIEFPPLPSGFSEGEAKAPGVFRLLARRKILVIVLLTLLFELTLASGLSFVPLLAHGSSGMMAGYYYSFLALVAVFLRLYAGKRLRFWGRSELILPAFAFLSIGAVILYFSVSNWHLIVSGLIWGLGVGILYPHLSALVVSGVTSRERSRILGIFAASVDLGFALGPMMFGFVSQSLGVRESFPVLAGGMFILTLLLIFIGRRDLFTRDV